MPALPISVILPFYQHGEEFDNAIQSILNQSFPDFELILVNNNANPAASQIATKWADKDPRIRLIYEPEQGIAHALNTGLLQAQGRWIARMDADDISHPDRLEKQWHFVNQHPDIKVVACQTRFASTLKMAEGYQRFVDWQNSIITPWQHQTARFRESPLAHPSLMFSRSLIDKYGAYNTESLPEDYELWLRWMDQGVQFYKLPEILLTWNDHEGRLSRNHENYSKEAFFVTKIKYMAKWLKHSLATDKKIIVCGASKIGRKRAALLQSYGIEIYGYTDVKARSNRQIRFVRIEEITKPDEWFLINFIGKRGVAEQIDAHFNALGFQEGLDYIHGA